MKESSKVLLGVGLGILAGGVAGYFLASDEGKEFQLKTKAQLKQLESDVKGSIKDNSALASEKLAASTEKAKSWVDDISKTVKEKISKTSNYAENAADEVQDGINNA